MVESDSRTQDIGENHSLSAGSPDRFYNPLDANMKDRIQHWEILDRYLEVVVRKTLDATRFFLTDRGPPSWAASQVLLPYRLFRRMVASEWVAQGDRSFATLGVILSSIIAVVPEVQALWVAASLAGGLGVQEDMNSTANKGFSLASLSLKAIGTTVSENAIFGSFDRN